MQRTMAFLRWFLALALLAAATVIQAQRHERVMVRCPPLQATQHLHACSSMTSTARVVIHLPMSSVVVSAAAHALQQDCASARDTCYHLKGKVQPASRLQEVATRQHDAVRDAKRQ
jgi:hypothetical protein